VYPDFILKNKVHNVSVGTGTKGEPDMQDYVSIEKKISDHKASQGIGINRQQFLDMPENRPCKTFSPLTKRSQQPARVIICNLQERILLHGHERSSAPRQPNHSPFRKLDWQKVPTDP
jgi:hypothetical protein